MPAFSLDKRSRFKLLAVGGAILVFLLFYVEDWGRDFTSHDAELSQGADNEILRPLVVTRPSNEMVHAVKMAASRIRNWKFAGEANDGQTAVLYFVRQNRLLRLRDDIVVRIENLGDSRVVHAASRARLHVGDLGRNPRNLERFMNELRTVLEGSAYGPVLEWTGPSGSRDLRTE